MSTEFTAFDSKGNEKRFGVRFFGGRSRGTVFRFFDQAGRFEDCVRFEDESGQQFDRREFFEVVSECAEREFAGEGRVESP